MRNITILAAVGLTAALLAAGLDARAQTSAAPGAEPSDQAEGSHPFEIGIEDVLEIVVWDEPALSRTVTVRPDGRITLPLIGDVEVAGLPTDVVQEQIRDRLANLVRDPNVTVIVEEIHSFRVCVLGEVNQQGVLEFRRPTRLLQALAAAGGLTEFSKKDVLILRNIDGRQVRILVDLKPLLGGDPSSNLLLQPDDTLLVS